MDVGQGTAERLWQQSGTGKVHMEPEAAQECAKVYEDLYHQLSKLARSADGLTDVAVIPGGDALQSTRDLHTGFQEKTEETSTALGQLQAATLTMAAGFLRAGGLFEQAEEHNRAAIRVAGQGLD